MRYVLLLLLFFFSQFHKIVLYLSAPPPSPPMKETTVHEVELGALSMDLSSDYTLYWLHFIVSPLAIALAHPPLLSFSIRFLVMMRRGDHMIILEQQILLERQVWLSTWNSLIATAMILQRRLLSQEVLKNTVTLWYYFYCFCSSQWFFYLWVLCPWRIKILKDKDDIRGIHPVGCKDWSINLNKCICRNIQLVHVISLAVIMAVV